MFDDSDDEFEDDYTESVKLITDLQNRLESKQKTDDAIVYDDEEKRTKRSQSDTRNATPHKDQSETHDVGTSIRTRSSNRLKNNTDNKKVEVNTSYDGNSTIEVLMDEIEDEQDVEYVIADAPEDPFNSAEDNDDLTGIMVDDADFDAEPFTLQNIGKGDDLESSDDSMDDKSLDGDETGNYHL